MSSFMLLRSFSTDTQQSSSSSTTTTTTTSPALSKQRGKLNKRFSFHHKQQQGVKELGEANKKSKAALTRRWSSLKQYQTTNLSQQSLATGGSSNVTSAQASPQNIANESHQRSDVRKKWEVIEHYKGTLNGRETVSSSLLAVSIF